MREKKKNKRESFCFCYTANVAKEKVIFLPSVIVYGSIMYPSSCKIT